MKLIGEYIVLSDNALSYLRNFLDANDYSKVFVLADKHTQKYCLPLLEIAEAELVVIKSGEENKNTESCNAIWQELSEKGADRKSVLINLGGGVIGDMGGFCAATFMRGIDFIHVPTTLLSMVDASCGGKLGVDLNGLKNYIGLFAEPRMVFIWPSFLKSLDQRQINSGIAEMLKHGLIADKSHFADLKEWNPRRIKLLIEHSVEIKYGIVEQDPFEENERKKLNFGHTVGHAIETYFLLNKKDILHGEAVAAGLIIESHLSLKTGLKKDELDEIVNAITGYFPKLAIQEEEVYLLFELMMKDKKNEKGLVNCTLLEQAGQAITDQYISFEEFEEALNFYCGL